MNDELARRYARAAAAIGAAIPPVVPGEARMQIIVVVRDVRELGENYIACDPRDLSEIVVPVRARDGRVTGVLDIDSYSVGAFGETDRIALEQFVADHLADSI